MSTQIDVRLDKSIANNNFFQNLKTLTFEKGVIFKYGILNEDVPEHIAEDNYEYLQGKFPYLESLYSDWISTDADKITNYSNRENSKRISEIIGVGIGILYFISLLKIEPNTVLKIEKPNDKNKYLDFFSLCNGHRYELEAKGTINEAKKNTFLKDINVKKSVKTNTPATKIGTITFARKKTETKKSYILVTDDFNEKKTNEEFDIYDYYSYYLFYLSFIYDSTYFNRLVKRLKKRKIKKNLINKKKFYTKYTRGEAIYFGQCFDRRLISNNIISNYEEKDNLPKLFIKLTKNVGKFKYFVGIDEEIINALNSLDLQKIKEYRQPVVFDDSENGFFIYDRDGLALIKANKNSNHQLTKIFPEEEVKSRITLIVNFLERKPHACGAPCRSRELKGKPCSKITYREHCHFHR